MRFGRVMAGAMGLMIPLLHKSGELETTLHTSSGQVAGTATFRQAKEGVEVKIHLENLPFGVHGVHIHTNAVCDAPDFKTAGGHFNPDGKKHGFMSAEGHHNGDLPDSVAVGENFKGSASFLLKDVSMDPAAPNSLFLHGGTSIVVHEKADDQKTDPSGASGDRIACGVIKQ
jgi:Cu-Zn family superoxide dismutase